jgi:hypothetical protein
MLMYADETMLSVLRLWVEENLMPVVRKHGVWAGGEMGISGTTFDDGSRTDGLWLFRRRQLTGYVYKEYGVKWYPDYPDIQAFEAVRDKFMEVFNEHNHAVTSAALEFVRVGEEYGDVEIIESYRSCSLLCVERNIMY